MFADVQEHACDQVFELVAAAKDFSPGKRAAGKVRLERLDETALLLGLKITLNGSGAGEAMGSAKAAFRLGLFKIKH